MQIALPAGRRRTAALAAGAVTGLLVMIVVAGAPAASAQDLVSSTEARVVVLRESPGKVVSMRKARRDGIDAWAVTVARGDLAVIVGYVDRGSGLLFDWAVVQRPTAGPKGR